MDADQEKRVEQERKNLLRRLELDLRDIKQVRNESRREYPGAHKNLEGLASALQGGTPLLPVTVRQLLRWFEAERRGPRPNQSIRTALRMHNLRTEPDFNETYIDDNLAFCLGAREFEIEIPEGYRQRFPQAGDVADAVEASILNTLWIQGLTDRLIGWIDQNLGVSHAEVLAKADELAKLPPDELLRIETPIAPLKNRQPIDDATLCVSRLKSANTKPTCVSPNDTITQAITIMEHRRFSQLPVVVGRNAQGMVSWHSIGRWLYMGKSRDAEVRECMDPPAKELLSDTPLNEAIDEIVKNQCVLIRSQIDKSLSGIVTVADLSEELRQLSESFLLLMEIENHVRGLILDGDFTVEDLRESADLRNGDRYIRNVDDLTLGEYLNLLGRDGAPSKLKLPIDLKYFNKQLSEIRRIRNSVMHFDLDPISDGDSKTLREFATFLRKIRLM